jgi:hypothetical protein
LRRKVGREKKKSKTGTNNIITGDTPIGPSSRFGLGGRKKRIRNIAMKERIVKIR